MLDCIGARRQSHATRPAREPCGASALGEGKPMFEAIFASALRALPLFLLHLGVTLAILALGVMIYMWVTPHHETRLMREGNVAAATSFGSAVLGLALPLAICLARSVNIADIVIWGVVALVVQLATFFVMSMLFKD